MAEEHPSPGHWHSGLSSPVAEINELMLEILRAAAHSQRERPRLIAELAELWRDLDTSAQRRLARCPYVLLDAGFAAPERWERLMFERGVMEGGTARGYFSSSAGVALVRRTLVFAWHLARSNRLTARVVLGMSAACAERIAEVALKDLELLAELCPDWIAPRWEGQPAIWRQMIRAALDDHETALRRVQSRGLQLMAAAHPALPHPEGRTLW
jgi:hypothetical protein